jgi:hypothetical protein
MTRHDKVANNATDDQLKARIAWDEFCAELGGVAVIVGLIAEVAVALALPGNKLAPIGSNVIIALGVAAEVLFSRKARTKSAELQRRSDEQVAEANARAAEARLETEKLKERMASRALTPDQQRAIAEELSAFKGQRVYLVAAPSTSETEVCMRLLAHVFTMAGWEIVGTNSSPKPLVIIPTGVIVQWFVPNGRNPWESPDAKAAFTACQCLNKSGIQASTFGGPIDSMSAITVIINTKE